MATSYQPWRRKMLVQSIPESWSLDMLENFMEFVTDVKLEDNGVEHFCGVNHSALLTFTEDLSEQHIRKAQTENYQTGTGLQFSLIHTAPSMILCRGVTPSLTHDNLFYYFDSTHSGGIEGEVEKCEMFPEQCMAVVAFSSSEGAAAVLAMEVHQPSKKTSIRVEPCYEDFHFRILDLRGCPVSSEISHVDNAMVKDETEKQSKPAVQSCTPHNLTKPEVLPKPSFTSSGTGSQFHKTSEEIANVRAGNESEEFLLCSEPEECTDSHEDYENTPRHGHRVYHRGKRNSRTFHTRGNQGAGEVVSQSEKSLGDRNQHHSSNGYKSRGKKRHYGKNFHRGRGRGRGIGFISQSQETAELVCTGPDHVTSHVQSSAHRPIRLDADCNPISQDSVSGSKKNVGRSTPSPEKLHEVENLNVPSANHMEVSLESIKLLPKTYQDPKHKQNIAKEVAESAHLVGPFMKMNVKAVSGEQRHENISSDINTSGTRQRAERVPVPNTSLERVSAEIKQLQMEEKMRENEQQKMTTEQERAGEKRVPAEDTQEIEEIKSKRQAEREKEEERLEYQKLKEKIKKLEAEQERAVKASLDAEKKLQKVTKENEILKNRKKEQMQFPAYQLHLMQDFAKQCSICDIVIHEKEEFVEFCGAGDDFDNVKQHFLLRMQERAEDTLPVPAAVSSILKTEAGQHYLHQICPDHSSIAFDVQDSLILCASFEKYNIQKCIADLKENVQEKKLKVSKILWAELQTLKQKCEEDFPLARILLPSSSDDCEITVAGINGDFKQVLRKLKDHFSQNQPAHDDFTILEPVAVKACKLWHLQALDDVKTMISKHHGEWKVSSQQTGYQLSYQCQRDVLPDVQRRLETIKKAIEVSRIVLQFEFKKYSERALVINGLHNEGAEVFCRQLEEKLRKDGWESIISFSLPPKCKLPKLEYSPGKHHGRSSRPAPPKPRRGVLVQPRRNISHRHHRGKSMREFKTGIGNSSFIIKSGDIAQESVDGIVCVVGEDLDLSQTAVGQSIVKKYPQCAQAQVSQKGRQGEVILRNIPAQAQGLSPLQGLLDVGKSATDLYLAVLAKWTQQQAQAILMTMVQKCLQLAERQGNRSLVFPPMGYGRKFQLPFDAVLSAMVTTIQGFLKNNPSTPLQTITIVIYDTDIARKFRDAAKQMIHPSLPADLSFLQQTVESASDDDDDDDDEADEGDSDGGDFYAEDADFTVEGLRRYGLFAPRLSPNSDSEDVAAGGSGSDDDHLHFFDLEDKEDKVTYQSAFSLAPAIASPDTGSSSKLEAKICVKNKQDVQNVKAGLLRELRSTFVHEKNLQDTRTFKKLGTKVIDEINAEALKRDVVLKIESRGGKDVLVVRGQEVGVTGMIALIKDRLHTFMQKEGSRDHRQQGHLPSASSRTQPPSYWKIQKDGIFKSLEQWVRDHRKYGKLHKVSDAEHQEISTLIQRTWEQRYVGHGKDGVNLHHRGIQVSKVERLENPNLWEEYCVCRERLLRRGQAFLPLEKVKGSSGPLKTSSNLTRRNALSREMFPQVNEHYLFHGTKKDYIQAIHDQGLDTRIASERAMLGRGVYASESATKADQYTDDKTNRTGGNKTLILMRVLLGEPFINKHSNPTKYSRAPCKHCYLDKCKCIPSAFFDSVIDDAGRNFREFVVYDRCQCYPEYFVTYQRL